MHGLAHGFLNWDWDRPLFNLYDGLNVLTAMAKVYKLYKDNGDDYDVYQNFYDIAIMYNYNMNFVNTGGVGSGTLYLMSPIIKEFIIANKADWMLLPFFAYFGVQWISDILIMYDTFDFRFSNHYDLRNFGYLVGKVASNYFNLMAFIDLV